MIKYGINTDDRYFGRNVIIRLDELKTELIDEFIEKMEFIELQSQNPKKMAREYKLMYKERLNAK